MVVREASGIYDLARLARRSIEPGLPLDLDGKTISAGACLHAALVVIMLCRRFWGYPCLVRGGHEGARDVRGVWHGHYWVEVQVPAAGVFVVDITADQFGHAPVVVLTLEESRSLYRPGVQSEVDNAFESIMQEFQC